jgi:hypothetical protein
MPTGLKLTSSEISDILTAILTQPQLSYKTIAAQRELAECTVRYIATRHNIHRPRGSAALSHRKHNKAVPRG